MLWQMDNFGLSLKSIRHVELDARLASTACPHTPDGLEVLQSQSVLSSYGM
jgi:hypothetical protein